MRCAVFDCDNTDSQRMHRFPECKGAVQKWRESLRLREFPIELLQARFGVCSLHFSNEDYEDQDGGVESERILKENAVPQLRKHADDLWLGTSLSISANGETECIRIMAPTNANIALLQPRSFSKPYRTRSMEFSTASTGGNTDISVLKTHDSHYGDDDDTDGDDDLVKVGTGHYYGEVIDAPDFTVVSCPSKKSIEFRRFHHPLLRRNAYSGTDSDIEILMSEEINETKWSAASENYKNNFIEQRSQMDDSIEAILVQSLEENTPASTSRQNLESTDRDCSVEELSGQSCASFDDVEELSHEQLVNMVRSQRARIQDMESTLTRFRSAQQSLFDHVDAMRQEFASNASATELDKLQITSD